MNFRKIDYLSWTQRFMGKVRYDLARSSVSPVSREELGIDSSSIELANIAGDYDPELVSLLAKRYQAETDNVFVTHGATMGLFLVFAALLEEGNEVLLEAPNYEPLYRLAVHLKTQVKILDRPFDHQWQIDLEQVERKINRNTRAIIFSNFHNPSGASTNPEKMMTLCQIARDYKAHVIVSEVYLDNTFNNQHKSAFHYGPSMISINSLSRVYGLPHLRVGWIVATESVIQKAARIADYVTGSISYPSQRIAAIALKQAPFLIERSRHIVSKNLSLMREWMRKHEELKWLEPEGGTICFIKLPTGVDDVKLSEVLRGKYETLVAPGTFFWAKGFVRISLGNQSEILQKGLHNFEVALNELERPKF